MKRYKMLSSAAFVLFALVSPCQGRDEDAAAKAAEEKIAEYDEAVNAFRLEVREAPPEKRGELLKNQPQADSAIEEALSFIAEFPAHTRVPKVATWILLQSRSGKGDPTLVYKALLENHLNHADLAEATMSALYGANDESAAFLATVLEKAERPEAKGAAAYVLAYKLRRSGEEDQEKRLEYLRTAVKNLGDLEIRGQLMKPRAEGQLFAAEHLAIGMVAPEIEGEDTAGVKFKLSDYRGKVVVLDFWGHW